MQCLENGCFNAHYRIFKFSTFGFVLLLNGATNWKPAIAFHTIREQTMAFLSSFFLFVGLHVVLFVSICVAFLSFIRSSFFSVRFACVCIAISLSLFLLGRTECGCLNWMVISKTSETTLHLEVSTTLLHLKFFHFPWRKWRKNDNLRMKHENALGMGEQNDCRTAKQTKNIQVQMYGRVLFKCRFYAHFWL